MSGEAPFRSQRSVDEELRRYKYETFDKFVDLALDGVITLEQALVGFTEQLEPEEEVV